MLEGRRAAACKKFLVVLNCARCWLSLPGAGEAEWMVLGRRISTCGKEMSESQLGVTHVGEIWWISKIWTLFENRTPKVKSCLTGSQRRNTGLMCCKYSESCHQGSHRHADPFPLGCECMLVAEQRKQLLVQRYVGTGTCNSLSNTASYKGLKDQSTDYCTLLQGVWP